MTEEMRRAKARVKSVYPEAIFYKGFGGHDSVILNTNKRPWFAISLPNNCGDAAAAWVDAASRLPADPKAEPVEVVTDCNQLPQEAEGGGVGQNNDDKRPCGLQGNWCYVHHCYPATCKEMGHGEYSRTVLKRRLVPGASAPPTHNAEFLLGFAMALAVVNRQHDQPTLIKDAMDGYGITVPMLKNAGVEDYDLKEIRELLQREVERLKEQLVWIRDHVQEFGKSANLPVVVSRASRVLNESTESAESQLSTLTQKIEEMPFKVPAHVVVGKFDDEPFYLAKDVEGYLRGVKG